eukprot:4833844-Lingulodinium_polyedra.AAC.1
MEINVQLCQIHLHEVAEGPEEHVSLPSRGLDRGSHQDAQEPCGAAGVLWQAPAPGLVLASPVNGPPEQQVWLAERGAPIRPSLPVVEDQPAQLPCHGLRE